MNIRLRVLKAKIRGLEAEGRSIRAQITRSSGARKAALWQRKRDLGNHTRAHLIAYAILRNVPYEKVERNSACMIDVKSIYDVVVATVPSWEQSKWTVQRVRDYIWAPAPVQNVPPQVNQDVPAPVSKGSIGQRVASLLGLTS